MAEEKIYILECEKATTWRIERSRQAEEAVNCDLCLRRDYLKHFGFVLTACNNKNKGIRTLHSNLLFNLLLGSSLYLLCVNVYIHLSFP